MWFNLTLTCLISRVTNLDRLKCPYSVRTNQPHSFLTNTLMMNFLPYSIRRPFYYVFDLIVSSDFRREEFGRIFDSYEYEQGTQILGFINYLGITGQLDLNDHFNMFADAENLEQAIAIWEGYQDLTILTPSK
jgi:hypothetical protein